MSNFAPIIPPKHAEHWMYEAFRSISAQLSQHALDLSAVGRGETPDGSGRALIDIDTSTFFLLPGRGGGQTAYGGTGSGQSLTLSSNASGVKGFIYLGTVANSRVAYDETNNFFGIGTDTPSARLHLNLATSGTSGNSTFGTHFMDVTVGQTGYIYSGVAYQNGAGTDWAFVIGGANPGVGIGSVLFMNQTRSISWRLAMGTYGTDTISYLHQQHGALDTTPPHITVNNNVLFLGFNDNCGLYETHHFRHFNVWAEGDNLSGSAIFGKTVTATNMAIIGFNSPTTQRIGTSNYYDQPVVTIGGGAWYQSYHGVTLRLTSGNTFASTGGTEGAEAKQEVFQIHEGGSLNSGSGGIFAVDRFGRLCLYNPGNGGLTSRISGRRSIIAVEDGVLDSGTPSVQFEIHSINAWADGSTAIAAHRIGLGYDDVQTSQPVRNAILCGNSRVATSEPSLLNRLGIRASAVYITDGTFTYNTGQVGAPLGMLNIFNFVNNATILLALKRKSGQTGDLTTWYDSDGSTKLAYIDKDGNASFASIVSVGASSFSDALFTLYDNTTPTKKLAWQLSGLTAATTRTWTVQDADGTVPLLETANNFSGACIISGGTRIQVDGTTSHGHFADQTTVSKVLALVVAGISTSTTRVWSAQDISGRVVIVGDDTPSVASGSLGHVQSTANAADISTTDLTNAPPTGDYLVEIYLQTTTLDAGAGTLTVTIGWTDTVGATTDTSVTLALTSTGRARGLIAVKRVSGEITYAVTGGGTYGAARYAIDIRVIALG